MTGNGRCFLFTKVDSFISDYKNTLRAVKNGNIANGNSNLFYFIVMNAIASHFSSLRDDARVLAELCIIVVGVVPPAFAVNNIFFVLYSGRTYKISRVV